MLEYAYRYHSEYEAVFWVKADTRENLLADMLAIATVLDLPERDAPEQSIVVRAVQRWLQTHSRWLLIFDNADALEIVRECIPAGFKGHILLTTRMQSMGGLAQRIEVDLMTPEVGALFLLRRSALIGAEASLEQVSAEDRALALQLVHELGGLPLALDQAGAYMEESEYHLEGYLQLYQKQRAVLLKRRGGLVTDHPASVATTWLLSFEQVEQADALAADLLRLCAFLDPDAIPEELLFAGLQQLAISSSEIHQLRFNEAIGSLLRFSLVRRNGDTHTITVHRLIQSVVHDNLLPEKQSEWIHRVIHLLSEAFPPAVEVTNWPLCEKFLPHALLCTHWIELAHIPSIQAASLLLTIRKRLLGVDHPETATSLNGLALLYAAHKKYAKAEPLFQQAVTIRKQVLGTKHLHTTQSMNALALLYRDQGEYEKAELLL